MAGYIIVEVDITDAKAYESYKPLAAASVARHGGKFIVRGGQTETLEGGWSPKRVVVLEFPTIAQAREFYRSADYAPALAMRLAASKSRAIMVEGA